VNAVPPAVVEAGEIDAMEGEGFEGGVGAPPPPPPQPAVTNAVPMRTMYTEVLQNCLVSIFLLPVIAQFFEEVSIASLLSIYGMNG
jgi:hypothetical protein